MFKELFWLCEVKAEKEARSGWEAQFGSCVSRRQSCWILAWTLEAGRVVGP